MATIIDTDSIKSYISKGVNSIVYNGEDLGSLVIDGTTVWSTDLKFTLLSDGTYEVAARNIDTISGSVVIPSTYKGKAVTRIANFGFATGTYYSATNNDTTKLTSITMPNSIKEIGEGAFNGRCAIKSLTIPSSVTTIGSYAFAYTNSVTTFIIPSSVTTMGSLVFAASAYRYVYCEATSKPDGWSTNWSYGPVSYYWYSSKYEISKWHYVNGSPNLWTEDDLYAMFKYTSYEDYASVGTYTRTYTSSAKPIYISSSTDGNIWKISSLPISNSQYGVVNPTVTSYSGLWGSSPSVSLNSDGTVTVSGYSSLGSNANSQLITSSVTISYTDFPTYLTKIEFPYYWEDENGNILDIQEIDENAFSNLTNLQKVIIPEYCSSIGVGAFEGCTSLATVDLQEGSGNLVVVGTSAFSGCTSLTEVVIPNSVERINSSAFYGCSKLATVWFGEDHDNSGSSLNYIGSGAFKGTVLTTFDTNKSYWNIGSGSKYAEVSSSTAASYLKSTYNDKTWEAFYAPVVTSVSLNSTNTGVSTNVRNRNSGSLTITVKCVYTFIDGTTETKNVTSGVNGYSTLSGSSNVGKLFKSVTVTAYFNVLQSAVSNAITIEGTETAIDVADAKTYYMLPKSITNYINYYGFIQCDESSNYSAENPTSSGALGSPLKLFSSDNVVAIGYRYYPGKTSGTLYPVLYKTDPDVSDLPDVNDMYMYEKRQDIDDLVAGYYPSVSNAITWRLYTDKFTPDSTEKIWLVTNGYGSFVDGDTLSFNETVLESCTKSSEIEAEGQSWEYWDNYG